jgi:hypothetical protein
MSLRDLSKCGINSLINDKTISVRIKSRKNLRSDEGAGVDQWERARPSGGLPPHPLLGHRRGRPFPGSAPVRRKSVQSFFSRSAPRKEKKVSFVVMQMAKQASSESSQLQGVELWHQPWRSFFAATNLLVNCQNCESVFSNFPLRHILVTIWKKKKTAFRVFCAAAFSDVDLGKMSDFYQRQ